jgi:hypothetical protein
MAAKAGIGGRGEIRTHETLARLPVFKTGALNHSATLPFHSLGLNGAGAQSYPQNLKICRSWICAPGFDGQRRRVLLRKRGRRQPRFRSRGIPKMRAGNGLFTIDQRAPIFATISPR